MKTNLLKLNDDKTESLCSELDLSSAKLVRYPSRLAMTPSPQCPQSGIWVFISIKNSSGQCISIALHPIYITFSGKLLMFDIYSMRRPLK